MKKYVVYENENTKQVNIVEGKLKSILNATEMEVEQAYNGSWYLKGFAPTKPAPTIQEQVIELEQQYQMNRWQREIILANGSSASEYSKSKAQEIETLAEQLRS